MGVWLASPAFRLRHRRQQAINSVKPAPYTSELAMMIGHWTMSLSAIRSGGTQPLFNYDSKSAEDPRNPAEVLKPVKEDRKNA
jgi:hypothetical protein